MKFPYPEQPKDWQTAYTRDDAHEDTYGNSARYGLSPGFAMTIGTLSITLFLGFFITTKINVSAINPYLNIIIFLGVFLLTALILFPIIQSFTLGFASAFLTEFYQPPEGMDVHKIVTYRLSGVPRLPPPLNMFARFQYLLIRDSESFKLDKWPAWSAHYLGGPISLIVFDGCALYLERGNRFSRVVGPGDKLPFLERYETIKYIVDLRPKVNDETKKETSEVNASTKDGIKITLKIRIESRIGDPKNNDPANNLTYPFDPIAVKKAIERYAVRWHDRTKGDPTEFTWIDAVWGQVTGIVPDYIGSRMLDDLFVADRKGGQILSPNSVQEIFNKLNRSTQGFGVYVTNFQVTEINLPNEVEQAQHEQWKAEKQSITTRIDGETKANSIRAREKARAEAQRDIILGIAEGLKKSRDGQFTEPILLSMSGVLDESLREPLTRAYLAKETLDTLEQLQKILNNPEGS
jgi:regulator of protease activity HflC (stomatin/prohibitin superfamily)